MIQNYDVDITDFLKLTNSGLFVADFVQVKAAIIKHYKLAYGDDIDLSTATADGVFINDLALIINNILKTVSTMYANLDVNQASGVYLDMLCRLANVKRKYATNSTASIKVTNNSDANLSLNVFNDNYFVDKSGTLWIPTKTFEETDILAPNDNTTIEVKCELLGPVEAPAGYIDRCINASFDITVEQENAANVGQTDETDADLRERRAQSNGAHGVTVLESLIGALLELDGIQDCKIYNNVSGSDWTGTYPTNPVKDETTVKNHDIYIILRQNNVNIDDNTIANLIYEKLTPGIRTTETDDTTNGISKSAAYIQQVLGQEFELQEQQNVYWKLAKPIHSNLTITIRPNQYFDGELDHPENSKTLKKIADAAMAYFNNLRIGIEPNLYDLQNAIAVSDPTFKGQPTFNFVSSTTLPDNPDTYFNYTVASYGTNSSNYIITLS